MQKDKKYYMQNQYSIRINSVTVKGNTATAEAQHLSPHKPGNKHLCSNTKYNQFFNEDILISCIKKNGAWKITDLEIKRAVDCAVIGYEICSFDKIWYGEERT